MKSLISLATVAVAAFSTALHAADEIESPRYDVVIPGDAAELRRYAPIIVAEVLVEAADTDMAGSMGFMPLANYIFGNNRPGESISMTAPVTTAPVTERGSLGGGDGDKIAMTAPVTTAPTQEGLYRVRFMMPSEWSMETLPAPADDRVALTEVPERFVVVAGFMGAKEQASITAAEEAVAAFITENGLTPAGPFTLAGYSAPSVPDPQKKWEVHQEVMAPQ